MENRNYRTVRRASAITRALLGVAVTLGILASCAVPLLGLPPVGYESVTTLIGDRGALHSVAGLYYTIGNTANRDIVQLEIDFSLFDENAAPVPALGANSFTTAVHHRIPAGELASFCTSLDDHVPSRVTSLVVSRFRVTTVTFADGSIWRNPGSYVYQGGPE